MDAHYVANVESVGSIATLAVCQLAFRRSVSDFHRRTERGVVALLRKDSSTAVSLIEHLEGRAGHLSTRKTRQRGDTPVRSRDERKNSRSSFLTYS